MKISTRGSYAIEAMIELTISDNLCSIREIATKRNCSIKYLEHIFRDLKTSGLVTSIRGKNGGYTLAKKASSITCKDIVLAVESYDQEVLAPLLKIENLYQDIQNVIYSSLSEIYIDTLAATYKKELENEIIYEI